MDKLRRHQLIRDIISGQQIRSQGQLVQSLKKMGLVVTQATISRDISELALTKTRNINGQVVYSIQEQRVLSPAEKLARSMSEFALAVDRSDNLVVVKTSPGAAQTVARGIDQANLADILGTVAGDDTILVIARDKEKGRQVVHELQRMMS